VCTEGWLADNIGASLKEVQRREKYVDDVC